MELTFTESIKDKTSRLASTPFSDIMEEATSELLLSPDYSRIMTICDSVNQPGKDYVVDVARAVRRRIDHKIPKVQYFAVIVVEALIKNCGPRMHEELSEQKGLQRDLVAIALRHASKDGEAEAKQVALQLIVDCSHWFRAGAATEKTKPLGELIKYVQRGDASLLANITPDTSVNISRASAPAPDPKASAKSRQQRQAQQAQRARRGQQQRGGVAVGPDGQPIVVDAIPVVSPKEEEISGMMDAVMLLADALNSVEQTRSSIQGDEMIGALASEVRKQHRHLSLLISSGADIENMEVLLSLTDSQVEVIQRLSTLLKNQGQETTANRIAQDHGLPGHEQPQQQQVVHQGPPGGGGVAPVAGSSGYATQVPEQNPPDIEAVIEQSRLEYEALQAQRAAAAQAPQQTPPAATLPPGAGPSASGFEIPPRATGFQVPSQDPAPNAVQTLPPPTPAPVNAFEPAPQAAVYQQPPPQPVHPAAPVEHQAPAPAYTAPTPAYTAPPLAPAAQPDLTQMTQTAGTNAPGNRSSAPTIDDLFGDATGPVAAPVAPVAPPPPPAPPAPQPATTADLYGTPADSATTSTQPADIFSPAPVASTTGQGAPAPTEGGIRSAADIDDAPAPVYSAPPPPPPPPATSAFPAPAQQMDPSQVDAAAEVKTSEPAVVGSLNGDDEFDAFLNNRLGS